MKVKKLSPIRALDRFATTARADLRFAPLNSLILVGLFVAGLATHLAVHGYSLPAVLHVPGNWRSRSTAMVREEVEERRRMGISAPGESPDRPPFISAFNSTRRMDLIASTMAHRGHPDRVIKKVLGASFARALAEAWRG